MFGIEEDGESFGTGNSYYKLKYSIFTNKMLSASEADIKLIEPGLKGDLKVSHLVFSCKDHN